MVRSIRTAALGLLAAWVVAICAVPALAVQGWLSPVGGQGLPTVLAGFDPPAQRWLPGHRGVDLLAFPRQQILAAGAGTVTYAATLAGRGVVTITHGALRTTYEPVDPAVSPGDEVAAGQLIGYLGAGGHCSYRCLHWGLLRGDTYLNPLLLLGLLPPVLKPPGQPGAGTGEIAPRRLPAPAIRSGSPPADTPTPAPSTRRLAAALTAADEQTQNPTAAIALASAVGAAGATAATLTAIRSHRRRKPRP